MGESSDSPELILACHWRSGLVSCREYLLLRYVSVKQGQKGRSIAPKEPAKAAVSGIRRVIHGGGMRW